jgi:hypothetical protein
MAEGRDERIALLDKAQSNKPNERLPVLAGEPGQADLLKAIDKLKKSGTSHCLLSASAVITLLLFLVTAGLAADAIRRKLTCDTNEDCSSVITPEIIMGVTAFLITGICGVTTWHGKRAHEPNLYSAFGPDDYDFICEVGHKYNIRVDAKDTVRNVEIAFERKAVELKLIPGKPVLPFFAGSAALPAVSGPDVEAGLRLS